MEDCMLLAGKGLGMDILTIVCYGILVENVLPIA
jgi:hypothetical protein